MNTAIRCGIVFLLLFGSFSTQVSTTFDPFAPFAPNIINCVTKECLKEYAIYEAKLYSIDEKKFLATIQGESGWKITATGDGGKSMGIVQYQLPTFLSHSIECGFNYDGGDWMNPFVQIQTMACAFSNGRAMAWTAYRNLTRYVH